MTATQKHDIIPICTTVLSADQPPKEDIMLDQQKITILYCRLSNEDAQEGESNSIANQREYLTRYARDHGYTNLKILVDDGYTGTNFNRPGVQDKAAEARIEDKKIDKKDSYLVIDIQQAGYRDAKSLDLDHQIENIAADHKNGRCCLQKF